VTQTAGDRPDEPDEPEQPPSRSSPPPEGDELAVLSGFLDFLREAIVIKVTGVDVDDLRHPMTDSGVSLLGIVKHLAYVERWWFARTFSGLDVAFPFTDDDPDADWRIEADEHAEVIVDLYRTEIERSRAIAAASGPEDQSAMPGRHGGPYSLRWIMVHMIEETGRHAGHADILREQLDGATGE
jgi:uncharacterized damage-inducible protein DinB